MNAKTYFELLEEIDTPENREAIQQAIEVRERSELILETAIPAAAGGVIIFRSQTFALLRKVLAGFARRVGARQAAITTTSYFFGPYAGIEWTALEVYALCEAAVATGIDAARLVMSYPSSSEASSSIPAASAVDGSLLAAQSYSSLALMDISRADADLALAYVVHSGKTAVHSDRVKAVKALMLGREIGRIPLLYKPLIKKARERITPYMACGSERLESITTRFLLIYLKAGGTLFRGKIGQKLADRYARDIGKIKLMSKTATIAIVSDANIRAVAAMADIYNPYQVMGSYVADFLFSPGKIEFQLPFRVNKSMSDCQVVDCTGDDASTTIDKINAIRSKASLVNDTIKSLDARYIK